MENDDNTILLLTLAVGIIGAIVLILLLVKKQKRQDFDQTFDAFARNTVTRSISTHREKYKSCKFVKRIVPVPGGGQRVYFLHVPGSIPLVVPSDRSVEYLKPEQTQQAEDQEGEVPMVILLHGSDETAFDTHLLRQTDGQTSWLDLSDEKKVILVYGQAQGRPSSHGSLHSTEWSLDDARSDYSYLDAVYTDVRQLCPRIDPKRVYLVGLGRELGINGAVMASDFALSKWAGKGDLRDKLPVLSFNIAGVCLFSGGINGKQLNRLGLNYSDDTSLTDLIKQFQCVKGKTKDYHDHDHDHDQPDVLLMSSKTDKSIELAARCFLQLGYLVKLEELSRRQQEHFRSDNTRVIWQFFSNCPHPYQQLLSFDENGKWTLLPG